MLLLVDARTLPQNLFRHPMKQNHSSRLALLLGLFTFAPVLAQAHPGHGAWGVVQGAMHPMTGWDHVLAMVAVGIWAVQLGGRALWAVPASFVTMMVAGGALGMAGVHVPMVEQGIAASVLVLGLLIAMSARAPLAASMLIVGVFAVFHGYSHGAEMPATSQGLSYAAGFAVMTAALHVAGMGLGLAANRLAHAQWLRYAGGAIMACGVVIAFA